MVDQKEIIEAIADSLTLPVADIDLESNIQDDLGLNPIEKADLIADMSQRFKIVFDPGEVEQVKSVGDLVELIEDKLLE